MVVSSHSAEFLNRLGNNPHIGPFIGKYVSLMQPIGTLGVELFFVLSGFLIGTILIQTFDRSTSFTFREITHFWIRRWFRTLPVYWLILTVDIILYYYLKFGGFEPYKLLYYFFLQNAWRPHPQFFFGEAWSLSIEEWFYLTLPLAMYVTFRLSAPRNKKKFLLRVFSGYLVFFILLRFVNAFHPLYGPDQDAGIRKIVVFRLDAVMYGVLVAYFNTYHRPFLYRLRYPMFFAGLLGFFITWYYECGQVNNITMPADHTLKFLSDAFLYTAIPVIFALCLPLADSVTSLPGRFSKRFFTHISKISYSMYLVHYSLIFMPFFYYLKLSGTAEVVLYYFLYWFTVITLSTVLYRWFEYPVMQLRERFGNP